MVKTSLDVALGRKDWSVWIEDWSILGRRDVKRKGRPTTFFLCPASFILATFLSLESYFRLTVIHAPQLMKFLKMQIHFCDKACFLSLIYLSFSHSFSLLSFFTGGWVNTYHRQYLLQIRFQLYNSIKQILFDLFVSYLFFLLFLFVEFTSPSYSPYHAIRFIPSKSFLDE